MGTENSYRGLEEYAVKLIQIKARQLAGKAGFAQTDREDLEQELAIDLLRRLPNFKPSRSRRKTFISQIVEHKVCSLIAAQKAECRDFRLRGVSLHDEVLDMDGHRVERWQAMDGARYRRNGGRSAAELLDLRLDLAETIGGLPPVLARLCRDIEKATITEVSLARGIPRSTIYNAIKRIHARFADLGIAEYWGPARRNGAPAGRKQTEAKERPTSSGAPQAIETPAAAAAEVRP